MMNATPRRLAPAVGLASSLLLLTACGDAASDPSRFAIGPESADLGAPTNQARCNTCHAQSAADRGGSGSSFVNLAYLSSFKGGTTTSLLEAANACVAGWMGGLPLMDADPEWAELREYLESISDPSVTTPNPLMPEVLANEAAYEEAYAGGDATRGRAGYETHCARCHDEGLIVGNSDALPLSSLRDIEIGRIAQQVRTSGPPPSGTEDAENSTPGPMPFFEPADLSRDDLRDIIAFVRM